MSWIKCEKHKLSVADGSRIPCPDCLVEKARAEVLAACISFVDKQANDEGLWFRAQTAPEAYLQKELRRLHALIESQPAASDLEELLWGEKLDLLKSQPRALPEESWEQFGPKLLRWLKDKKAELEKARAIVK